MTETKSTDTSTDRRTMVDVDHVHRYDPGTSVRLFGRGPAAMTDGGHADEREVGETGDPRDEEDERGDERRPTMKDVSHTPPSGDREVNRVFERGEEGSDAR